MHKAVVLLLQQCDGDVVGSFRGEGPAKLESFCVPTESTWRPAMGHGFHVSLPELLQANIFCGLLCVLVALCSQLPYETHPQVSLS